MGVAEAGLRNVLPPVVWRWIIAKMADVPTLTRDQRRSLAYNYALVGVLRREPGRVLAVARRNLRRLKELHPHAAPILAVWERALSIPLDALIERMLGMDEEACEMRHASPFAGVLDAATRTRVIREFQKSEGMP